MTDMGRRAGPGDMTKEEYDVNEDGVVDEVIAHKASHQNGGSDEVNVAGLSGALADEQPSSWAGVSGKPSTFTPSAHKASHQNGGSDEINVAGLSGALADEQLSAWDAVSDKPSTFTPSAHKATHQNGGDDEIDCTGLDGTGGAGLLVDGTSGRVLRALFIIIGNGTDANTLKCRAGNLWNGHTVSEQNNIVKDGTTGVWSLNSGGYQLWIEVAGLGVNAVFCAAHMRCNDSNVALRVCGRVQTNRLRIECSGADSGADQDMTLAVNTGEICVDVLYITDA